MILHQVNYSELSYKPLLRFRSDANYFFLLFRSLVETADRDGVLRQATGFLIFLHPGETAEIKRLDDCFVYDLLEFSPNSAELQLINTLPLPQGACLPPNLPVFSALIGVMFDAYYSADIYRVEKNDAHLLLLLYGIASGDEMPEDQSRRNMLHHKLRRLRTLISDDITKNWTVKEAAAYTGLSVSRFSCLYKDTFGTSFISDLIRVRIRHSCVLLSTTEDTVETIAGKLGYGNVKFFYRQFKQHIGVSPGEYRKKGLNVY